MTRKLLLTFCTCFFFSQNSFANFQTFTSLSALDGSAFGNRTDRQTLNHLGEYPLSDKTALGEIAQLSYTKSNYNGGTSAYSLNTLELFHRYKFFSSKYVSITVHNSYRFGGIYNENPNLGLMPRQDDYELRLLFAHNMPDRLVNTVVYNTTPYFARAEVAYRRRFSNPFDEYRFNLWAGAKINEDFSFLLQNSVNWGIAAKSTASENSRTNITHFNWSKELIHVATFSLLYHYNHDSAIQFGYSKRFSGNAPFYDSHGFVIGLWNSF